VGVRVRDVYISALGILTCTIQGGGWGQPLACLEVSLAREKVSRGGECVREGLSAISPGSKTTVS